MRQGKTFAGVAVAALFLALPAGASAGVCETQTNPANVDITEAGPNESLVTTIGEGGDLTDVDVHLDIVHPNPEQLAVYVQHAPILTQLELTSGNGAGGENYSGTILDDEALNPIDAAPAPFTGRWRPELPLSFFDGQGDGGAWRLYIFDQNQPSEPDEGYLDSWGVTTSSTTCDGPTPPPGGGDPGTTPPPKTTPPKKCKKGQKLKRGKCVKKKKRKKKK